MKNVAHKNKILLAVIGIMCLYLLFSVKYSVQNLTYQKKYMAQGLSIENHKLKQIHANLTDLTKDARIQGIASIHLEVGESKTNQIKSNTIRVIKMNEAFNKVNSHSWRYKKSINNYIRAWPKTNHVY